jgi:hypothetical protein
VDDIDVYGFSDETCEVIDRIIAAIRAREVKP